MKKSRLSESDRYRLEALRSAKVPVKDIAAILNKSVSCIYYELRKGKVWQRDQFLRDFQIYKADAGQRVTDERKVKRGSHSKLSNDPELLQLLYVLIVKKNYLPGLLLLSFTVIIISNFQSPLFINGFIPD